MELCRERRSRSATRTRTRSCAPPAVMLTATTSAAQRLAITLTTVEQMEVGWQRDARWVRSRIR